MPTFAEYNAALQGLRSTRSENTEEACGVIPFSPAIREPAGALIYWNHGCGAGNLVPVPSPIQAICSHAASWEPISKWGIFGSAPSRNSRREAALEGFRKGPAKRPHGCRARALWLNGSVDAADPWAR